MNRAAANHLAARLAAGLVHPGDENTKPTPLPLPGLASTGIPSEQAAEFANAAGLPQGNPAQLVAEAILACLEEFDGGSVLITNTELAALRQAAADAPTGTRVVAWHCLCDNMLGNPLLTLAVGKDDHVLINAKPILRSLHSRSIDCPHNVVTE